MDEEQGYTHPLDPPMAGHAQWSTGQPIVFLEGSKHFWPIPIYVERCVQVLGQKYCRIMATLYMDVYG